ncbi:MAG: DUF4007 family protein [Promethearchaeota archaeon]
MNTRTKTSIDVRNLIELGGVSRHETFTPRYGWLKKGFDAAEKDGTVFSAPDAIERVGVGKNMVRSIRSWCLAFKLLEYQDGEARLSQRGQLGPSELGKKLLDNNGWDPYLEDLATLWLLHWHLFIPPIELASWPIAFNHCTLATFDLKQLKQTLITSSKQYEKLSGLSKGSFEKDASCLIRMYSYGEIDRYSEIDCPFTQIGIIYTTEDPHTYRFNISEKQSLPSLIFAAACFSYADLTQPAQRTLSLHKIVYEYNSPGIVFKLSETEAGRLLNSAVKYLKNVEFVESMGNRQLQFDNPPAELFWQALDCYYSKN